MNETVGAPQSCSQDQSSKTKSKTSGVKTKTRTGSAETKTKTSTSKTKTKTGKWQYITKCRSLTSYLIYVVNC